MIQVNLIRQYIFCPRIVYFNLLSNIKPVYPMHVEQGSIYHKKQDNLFSIRDFTKLNISYNEKLNNVYLEDETLGLCGLVDMCFICDNEVIAVEYKDTNKSSISYAHKMQLAAYSLLLSNTYKKDSSRCIIIYGNNVRFHEVFIKEQDILQLKKILSKINKMVEKAVFPDSSAGEKKCLQCEYLNYCDDRF